MGASINAATSKESTHLHARLLDKHNEEAFDLLAEMLLAPDLSGVDSEREVVLEEIAMYEDEPPDRVHDVLAGAVFGDHPLGRRVIGDAEVISSIPVPEIDAYHRARYTPPTSWSPRPGQPRARRDRRARRALRRRRGRWPPRGPPPDRTAGRVPVEGHRAVPRLLRRSGLARGDDRRFALAILDAVFGGSTSSRLFREVREKRGLAYAVGSYTQQYVDCGLIGYTSAPARTTSTRPARSSAVSWPVSTTEGVTDKELGAPRRTSRAAWCSD